MTKRTMWHFAAMLRRSSMSIANNLQFNLNKWERIIREVCFRLGRN